MGHMLSIPHSSPWRPRFICWRAAGSSFDCSYQWQMRAQDCLHVLFLFLTIDVVQIITVAAAVLLVYRIRRWESLLLCTCRICVSMLAVGGPGTKHTPFSRGSESQLWPPLMLTLSVPNSLSWRFPILLRQRNLLAAARSLFVVLAHSFR